MKKKLMTTMSLLQRLPTEWFAKKLMLAILLFAFTFPFALNATNYQEKYIWNKVYRPTNLALNSKALIMTLPAVTGQTHYSIQYILNKAFFPDSSALRVLIDSAAMAGIKVDSAFYADSSFNLFADSNYVVADLAVDTLDADSIKTRTAVVSDTLYIGDNKVYDSGLYTVFVGINATSGFLSTLYSTAISNTYGAPLKIKLGYAYDDSILFALTGAGEDTVIDVDSLNNVRIRNNMTVDDTLTIGDNIMYDNGTFIVIDYPYASTYSGVNIGVSGYIYTKDYRNYNGTPLLLSCGGGYNDSIIALLTGAGSDTVIDVDSLNNVRVWNNMVVDDTLKVGNNDMFDNGTYISTPYFQSTTQILSENTYSKYYYNISGEPVVFYCKHGFDDSIVFVLMGNTLAADTFLTADSLGNLLAYNNLAVKDTLIIGDNKMYDSGNYITFNSRISQKGLGYSTFLGDSAGLNDDLTDNKNTAIGYGALYATTSGSQNTSIGYQSMYSNVAANTNTSVGYQSMYSNTTGDENAVIGNTAMHSNKTGWGNTVIGYRALKNDTLGNYNVAIGRSALCFDITGSNNVAIGYSAGANATSGNNTASNSSVYIGYASKAYAVGDTNEIVIGANVVGAGSNTVTIGDTNIEKTILRGNVEVGTDDTLTYYNSNQILFKVIIQDSILTITQDAFTSFKFEKQELNTDTDYFLFAPANDSTKMVIKKAGYYKFKAKYAYDNNSGASVTDLLVAGRLTVNSKELLCSQILRQCEMKNATSRVLAVSGFFSASVNDTIRFEYYSSDPNIDFHTNAVFDSLFTAGMSLEYMK